MNPVRGQGRERTVTHGTPGLHATGNIILPNLRVAMRHGCFHDDSRDSLRLGRPTADLPAHGSVVLRSDILRLCPLLLTCILCCAALTGCNSRNDDPLIDAGHPMKATAPAAAASVPTSIRLRDVTATSGINFTYRNGQETNNYSIVESLGGGLGLGDLDGDHLLDVFNAGGGEFPGKGQIAGRPSGLFRQVDAWKFQDVTEAAGVAAPSYFSHGINLGDCDNDGFTDVLITGYGGVVFYHNLGDGTFQEEAVARGLTDKLWSSSSAWGDFNEDGALDLYIAHYVNWSWENHPACFDKGPDTQDVCPPRRFEPLPHILYLSNGDGTFRDGTSEFGLRKDGKGLGVVVGDADLDGHVDVYVGNDTVPNFLYRNTGKTFEDMGLMSGTALSDRGTPDGSMGVDLGDLTLDGLPDIWVANYESESFALYRNQGNFFFQHVSQPLGITAVGALFVGWGSVLVDFDHDADLDIFCSNGHVNRRPTNAPVKQTPLVFLNQSGQKFVNVAPQVGDYTAASHDGRGCAAGDVDNDGDVDIAVMRSNEPVALLSNESDTPHHWLTLRLIGTQRSRDAVGAIVRLKPKEGPEQVQQVKSGSSYASSSDQRLCFGLGASSGVSSLTIRWPGGATQSLVVSQVDTHLIAVEQPEQPDE